jgi:hypothetical protein
MSSLKIKILIMAVVAFFLSPIAFAEQTADGGDPVGLNMNDSTDCTTCDHCAAIHHWRKCTDVLKDPFQQLNFNAIQGQSATGDIAK